MLWMQNYSIQNTDTFTRLPLNMLVIDSSLPIFIQYVLHYLHGPNWSWNVAEHGKYLECESGQA